MNYCEICGREFPGHLLAPLVVSGKGTQTVCPICALRQRNLIHGLPKGTPFQGEAAQVMHAEAVGYLAAREGE